MTLDELFADKAFVYQLATAIFILIVLVWVRWAVLRIRSYLCRDSQESDLP